LTTAQTSGPGAASFLHDAASAPAASAANTRIVRFNRSSFREERSSSGLFYAAGTNAGGADAHVLAHAANHGLHPAQIWIPATPADIVGVADGIPEARFLAANFTYECHCDVAPH